MMTSIINVVPSNNIAAITKSFIFQFTLAIDILWHYHILDTERYERDCNAIYGKMLHHYPYFGMEGKADAKNFVNSFDKPKCCMKRHSKL